MRSPRTHKNGCANEGTTDLSLELFVMLFQDFVLGYRNAAEHLAAHKRQEMVTSMTTGT
jgi:hypothetical protein